MGNGTGLVGCWGEGSKMLKGREGVDVNLAGRGTEEEVRGREGEGEGSNGVAEGKKGREKQSAM